MILLFLLTALIWPFVQSKDETTRPLFFDELTRLSREAFDKNTNTNTTDGQTTKTLKYPYEVVSCSIKALFRRFRG